MSVYDFLRQRREDMPVWLDQFKDGEPFERDAFFGSRIVYYPGSGTDGQPVKLFGSTHSAHCFVYADFGVTQHALEQALEHPDHGFRGYHRLSRLQLRAKDLVPRGWTPHDDRGRNPRDIYWAADVASAPFGFLEVLERDDGLDDAHGARRLAILFLGADGIAAYDALFCQRDSISAPFALVLQDHGFGGNYNKFGGGGLLERIALGGKILPQWMLIAENTQPWNDFKRVPNLEGDRGGWHNNLRRLYRRS